MFDIKSEKLNYFIWKLDISSFCCERESYEKMKLVEALKLLSSLFTTGNLYFQLHDNYLNRESVSFYGQWLLFQIHATFFIFKCFDLCNSLNAALPIFEQRFNVTQFVRLLHLRQLETSRDESVLSAYYQNKCDGMLTDVGFFDLGLYYFINVDYDYKNKIWKSHGFETWKC